MSKNGPLGAGLDTNEREPETIDGETGKPDPSPEADRLLGRGYLSNLRDVRLAIAKVVRGEVSGKVEHNRAKGLVWMLRQLGDVIEVADLEGRLRELEARQADPALPGQRALTRTLN